MPTFGNPPLQEEWHVPENAEQELLAISITNLQGTYLDDHETYRWLFDREPIACIGKSIRVYDLAGDVAAHQRLEQIYRQASMVDLADREGEKIDRLAD